MLVLFCFTSDNMLKKMQLGEKSMLYSWQWTAINTVMYFWGGHFPHTVYSTTEKHTENIMHNVRSEKLLKFKVKGVTQWAVLEFMTRYTMCNHYVYVNSETANVIRNSQLYHIPGAGLLNLSISRLSCLEALFSILILTSLCGCQINDTNNLDGHPGTESASAHNFGNICINDSISKQQNLVEGG